MIQLSSSTTRRIGRPAAMRLGLILLAPVALAAWLFYRDVDRARLLRADPAVIFDDPTLAAYARGRGKAVFEQHCAICHRSGEADLQRGVPDLRDGDWLYGEGTVAEIETIVRHGIRSGDRKGWNLASMPAYATEHPYGAERIPPLSPRDIDDTVSFLLQNDLPAKDPDMVARGRDIFRGRGGCWDCHGNDAGGDSSIGAPNLIDSVWLFGGDPMRVRQSIAQGRAGISPAFEKRLDPADIRAVAVYTASLAHAHLSTDKQK